MLVDDLLTQLEREIGQGCDCQSAVNCCCRLLGDNASVCQLPDRCLVRKSDCYARHLVYLHPQDRYCVVAMVWGPGQGTSVHDHDGTWCVEGCFSGRLAISSYDLTRRLDSEHVEMKLERTVEVGVGAVGRLIPPYEHHRIHNPFDEPAVTLHVYGRELKQCTRFMETDRPGVFRQERVALSYASMP